MAELAKGSAQCEAAVANCEHAAEDISYWLIFFEVGLVDSGAGLKLTIKPNFTNIRAQKRLKVLQATL